MNNSERTVRSRKPSKCPACGAQPVADILYGLPVPTEKLEAEMRAGKIASGGCYISGDDPAWACTHCGLRIYRSEP